MIFGKSYLSHSRLLLFLFKTRFSTQKKIKSTVFASGFKKRFFDIAESKVKLNKKKNYKHHYIVGHLKCKES